MSLFEIRNLTKKFGQRTVLDIKALDLEQGKIYALLGPNGAGKTTLLEIISFLEAPTTGTIRYDSRPVAFNRKKLTELRQDVVLVHQKPVLFTTTVYKNVEYGLKVRNTPKRDRKNIIHELLTIVGMEKFSDYKAHRLSGGETQRVAIARALACNPRVLLFDEPTANVDIENQASIENIIAGINRKKNISIIMTTHNNVQAARVAHEILFLNQGGLADGIYENIFTGDIKPGENGQPVCRIQDILALPVFTELKGRCRVSIDPCKLKILESQDVGAGGVTLTGKVMQLALSGSMIRVIVHSGLPLVVLMDEKEYRKNPVTVGASVTLTCPPEAVSMA